jgi:3-oxoacyl-[acyl-carrier-protein] synthase II
MRNGDADVILAGGCEAPLTPLSFAGFCNLMAMNTNYNDNPTKASRPFDLNRGGFVMGEGAGVLVLETLSHAVKRGARVYCELAGYGASCDAYHITSPDPEGDGLKRALLYALKDAGGLRTDQVDYVNAHGTSTKKNDQFETIAFKHVFGNHATSQKLMISSIKGNTGHSLGAAGGMEAIACVKAIEMGTVPPTINYETPDPDCDLNITPNKVGQPYRNNDIIDICCVYNITLCIAVLCAFCINIYICTISIYIHFCLFTSLFILFLFVMYITNAILL